MIQSSKSSDAKGNKKSSEFFSICDLLKNTFKAATKESFESKNPNVE